MTTPTPKPYDPLAVWESSDGIRRFTNSKLQGAIDDAFNAAKATDKPFVVVAHQVYNQDGSTVENVTKISAFVKVGDSLSMAVGGYKDWTKGDLGAEAKVVWTPF